MSKKPKSGRIRRLARLLDDEENLSTEYVCYLAKLADTGDPRAAPVIARYLDMAGVVGEFAAQSLVRLADSSWECLELVHRICKRRIEWSFDSDEIRNASEVCDALARPYHFRKAA